MGGTPIREESKAQTVISPLGISPHTSFVKNMNVGNKLGKGPAKEKVTRCHIRNLKGFPDRPIRTTGVEIEDFSKEWRKGCLEGQGWGGAQFFGLTRGLG